MALPYRYQMTHEFKVQLIKQCIKCPDLESVHLNTNAFWQFHLSVILAGEFGCGARGVTILSLRFVRCHGVIH